jgi:uncharacterized protein (DUF58 family)
VLTRHGWLCLGGGASLLVFARLLGIAELYVFGAVALVIVAAATFYVRLTRLDIEVDRAVHPSRVHAGQVSRVEVRVRNLHRFKTPVLCLRDAVTGTTGAEVLVPPLDLGQASVATYRLPTDRRGIIAVGPLRVVMTDPFGLAQASTVAAPRVEVTVYPHVDDVRAVPFTTGTDPLAGALRPHAIGRSGDDFYALRPYVVGDDLRRIHWPSTARHDELLVRQQEQPWQGRTTVLLDVRRSAHVPDSLEAAVSAAASILTANGARRDLLRLVTTDGADSGLGSGSAHLQALLEHLAVVESTSAASLRTMLHLVERDGQGALVVVVGRTADDELSSTARLHQRFGLVAVVRVDMSDTRPAGATPGADVLTVAPGRPFPEVWNRAIGSAATRRALTGSVR